MEEIEEEDYPHVVDTPLYFFVFVFGVPPVQVLSSCSMCKPVTSVTRKEPALRKAAEKPRIESGGALFKWRVL